VLGHACHPAGVGPPTKVLILGAGPIGFVTMLAAHAFGSRKVVIADVSVEQLNVTTELGADATVLVSTDLKVRKEFRFILISNVRLLTLDWEGWMDANQFLYNCQCVLLLQHISFVLGFN
jgi:D-arabinose 1-dehydrogenase-like Zn-dependent alcohol dehydrogenase